MTKDLLGLRNLIRIERFKKKTKLGANGCVEWTTYLNERGYGTWRVNGVELRSHRISYSWANNTNIPDGMNICHSCDNRRCVNPEHLWMGTQHDNMQDMFKKGRCKHRNSPQPRPPKLNAEKVIAIRHLRGEGMTQIKLAKMFGVGETTISHVLQGKLWKHVTE